MVRTFILVTIAWVFFRAPDLHIAFDFLKRIATDTWHHPRQYLHLADGKSAVIYIIPVLLGDWWFRRNERHIFANIPVAFVRFLLYAVLLFCILYFFHRNSSFIYFQF